MAEDKKVLEFQDHLPKQKKVEDAPINFTEQALQSILGDENDEFAVFMAMDEDEFEVLSPIIYGHIVDSIHSPEARISIADTVKSQNLTAQEILDGMEAAKDALREQRSEEWSEQKIEFLINVLTVFGEVMVSAVSDNRDIVLIPIQKLNPDAKLPTYANNGDAGLDLYALDEYDIAPGETKLIPTGLAVALPKGYELQVRPKSGRALKTKLRVANTPGTIDSGYRDEIKVIIENVEPPIKSIDYEPVMVDGKVDHLKINSIEHGQLYHIDKDSKFAQLVLNAVPVANFFEVDQLSKEEDRGGGFGSSGLL